MQPVHKLIVSHEHNVYNAVSELPQPKIKINDLMQQQLGTKHWVQHLHVMS